MKLTESKPEASVHSHVLFFKFHFLAMARLLWYEIARGGPLPQNPAKAFPPSANVRLPMNSTRTAPE